MKPQISACPQREQEPDSGIDNKGGLQEYAGLPLEVALRQQIERNAQQITRNNAALAKVLK